MEKGVIMAWKVTNLGVQSELPQQSPRFAQEALRNIVGLGGSLLKGAAKIPASLADLSLAAEQKLTAPSERLSPEQYQAVSLSPVVEQVSEKASSFFPEGYLEPKGPTEKFFRNVAEAVPAFYSPGGGFMNAVTAAFGSEGGRQLAKTLDLGRTGEFLSSIAGAGLAAGIMTPKNLKKAASLKYREFDKSIPEGAKQSTTFTQDAIQAAEKNLIPEDKSWLRENILPEIEPLVTKKAIDISRAQEVKKYIEKIIRQSKTASEDAKKAADAIASGVVKDTVEAAKQYPSLAAQSLIDANSIYYGLNNLSPIRRFLRNNITLPRALPIIAAEALGPQALTALTGGIPGKLFGAGLLGRGIAEIAEPLIKSPAARKEILASTVPQIALGSIATMPNESPKWRVTKL